MSRVFQSAVSRRSIKRLRIDEIDLYLLHWRERTPPLQETVDAFEKLRAAGKSVGCLELGRRRHGGAVVARRRLPCAANQVLYNLQNRETEFDLLPLRRAAWRRAFALFLIFFLVGAVFDTGFVDRIPSAAEPVLISVADLAPIVLAALFGFRTCRSRNE
jgi:aryl-alcohol dehydrogenase-like predicted oxidoreductase